MSEAHLILSSLRLGHALATTRLIDNLDNILDTLPTVRPVADQRATLGQITLMLEGARITITKGTADFATVRQLRDAMVYLRAIRLPHDANDATNPLYNVTIWLAESLSSAGELARLSDIIAGAERLGITL